MNRVQRFAGRKPNGQLSQAVTDLHTGYLKQSGMQELRGQKLVKGIDVSFSGQSQRMPDGSMRKAPLLYSDGKNKHYTYDTVTRQFAPASQVHYGNYEIKGQYAQNAATLHPGLALPNTSS